MVGLEGVWKHIRVALPEDTCPPNHSVWFFVPKAAREAKDVDALPFSVFLVLMLEGAFPDSFKGVCGQRTELSRQCG